MCTKHVPAGLWMTVDGGGEEGSMSAKDSKGETAHMAAMIRNANRLCPSFRVRAHNHGLERLEWSGGGITTLRRL